MRRRRSCRRHGRSRGRARPSSRLPARWRSAAGRRAASEVSVASLAEQIRDRRVSACSTLIGMATQALQAVDHELLAAGEWSETGEWGEVESPYDGTVVGRVALGDA